MQTTALRTGSTRALLLTFYLSLSAAAALAADNAARPVTATSPPVNDGLPMPGFQVTRSNTAIVITDPQNDFLSPDGVTWGVVGRNVTENRTVQNLEALFKTADRTGMPLFVSPHYCFKHDHRWQFEGTLETLMHQIGMFDRPTALDLEGFEGSGADWLERYKPYINNGRTLVTSPHSSSRASRCWWLPTQPPARLPNTTTATPHP